MVLSPSFDIKREQDIVNYANSQKGDLTGYDCKKCLNRGYFYRLDKNGNRYIQECSCMVTRRTIHNLEKSGLSDIINRYSIRKWQTKEKWQEEAKTAAEKYASDCKGWFVASGTPGTGKSHICTAVCGMLLKKGMPVKYILWRDFATRAKAVVNDDDEYKKIVDPAKRVKVLYIDDFLKVGKGSKPTVADINLAFEIINARYASDNLLTIISAELTTGEMIKIDEALGSRIVEKSKGYYLSFAGKKNWRIADGV